MEKIVVLGIMAFLACLILGVFGGLGYAIYNSVQTENICKNKGGLYHGSVCFEITGKVLK